MAEISKLSGVAIADVAKVDAILKADIANINGLTIPSAAAFLLDTYTGAAAGYSTRRLASSATNLMRIREDAGDTETDIGYDSNGDLDTAAIATHCATANGFVVSWVDQSGNANNATQSTSGSQPQIYNGTAVITENGKPCVQTSGAQRLATSSLSATSFATHSGFVCAKSNNTSYSSIMEISDGGAVSGRAVWIGVNNTATEKFGSAAYGGQLVFGGDATSQFLGSFIGVDSGNSTAFVDGAQVATATTSTYSPSTAGLGLAGNPISGTYSFTGVIQECILYNSDESTNRTAIEGNVNAHYQIGNFGTPTSGLLATYTGAAAAYSVRQLANTAALSMRVREDATDTETNIGFDANGDLDTAAIAAHCGTANGYVVNWYDQAGSQNDATQSTLASQPQIYNGTAVITENGKPALDFDGTDDVLQTTHSPTTSHTTFAVTVPTTGVTGQIYTSSTSNSAIRFVLSSNSTNDLILYRGGAVSASEGSTLSGQYLAYLLNQSTVSDCRLGVDGSNVAASGNIGNGTPVNISLGGEPAFNFYGNLSMQELVIYDGNNSSNKAGIEGNINTYFSIY